MSTEEDKTSYPYFSFDQLQDDHDHHQTLLSSDQGFAFPIITDHNNNNNNNNNLMYNNQPQQQQQNPSHEYDQISFSNCLQLGAVEYNTLSNAFDLSCSSSDQLAINNSNNNNISNSSRDEFAYKEAPVAPENPNSSGSVSSHEAGVEEDSSKLKKDLLPKACEEDGSDGKSKNIVKAKKKDEKKKREPRFAFMTKSEIDNLEDGYRWRKYGQKAVKNSPFPRSYYRCTSQKCGVKKRIERSSQDPAVVITTYEGQHNHHSPATARGSAAAMLGPSLFSAGPQSFPHHHQHHQDLQFFPSSTGHQQGHVISNSNYFAHLINQQHQMQPQQPDQFGLLMPGMNHISSPFLHKRHP
ncbi:hypothetical protein CASFOL_017677 [Castilleja foliolosa]|uniref:WRKY domain-containing protein n=1 Tax=Castilleja foliolosa TaxID=1961234 RepID=A0ABD3DBG2_9LAMI